MKLVFLIDNMKFSGGRKLFFEYADFLRKAGHNVQILVREKTGELVNFTTVETINAVNQKTIPDCDLIVATTHQEVIDAVSCKKAEVVHFCQSFEITNLEQCLRGDIVPPQFHRKGLFPRFKLLREKLAWKRRLQYFNQVYRLPTHLVTASKHLQHELKKRYGRPVKLCTNGVHQELFYPVEDWTPPLVSANKPLRIINVGPYGVSFKGVPTTIKAIELLKSKEFPIHFSRVTTHVSENEKENSCIDKIYENISQEELGNLFRESDVFISNSTEGEGFGLPAMEALSTGLICVLSSIPSYQSFNDTHDFCLFVPEHDVWATVNTVENIVESDVETLLKTHSKALKVSALYSHTHACKRFEKILAGIIQSVSSGNEDVTGE